LPRGFVAARSPKRFDLTPAYPAFIVNEAVYLSTRFRLIGSFLVMAILVGGLSLIVGARLLTRSVFNEASNRVRQDLNSAWEIYRSAEDRLSLGFTLIALQPEFHAAVLDGDLNRISSCVGTLASQLRLDFAGLVSPEGSTLYRLGPRPGGAVNPAASLALERRGAVCGALSLSAEELTAENPQLAERARIRLVPTPKAAPRAEAEESEGLALVCALPVVSGGLPAGVLYGGVLLNRDNQIVDRVRDTVFRQEIYRGQQIGTATLFFHDLRIATNVLDARGERAIGTRASAEVKTRVLDQGERWTARAFVVRDWYITAYDPIPDVYGRTVGMLYVGVLEAKYSDLRRNTMLVFVLITAAGMALAVLLGSLLSSRLLQPVQRLIEASHRVSQGDLDPEIGPYSRSELGVLQRTFQEMLGSLRDRDRHQKDESELRLLQSEKQASVGRLAAGVAHEINNPLTGVLTFTHLLLKRQDLEEGMREDLTTIAEATERVRKIVKGLLDFSRQSKLEPQSTDINELIRTTIPLVANQALVKGLLFCFDAGPDIPMRTIDRSQFQSVLLNIILNALDATERGGHIDITTRLALWEGRRGIEIAIADTGHGIAPEHLDRIFDPFYTTKEVGKGTGLGLSVSQGIVEHHGGAIRARSRVGRGSTFTIWLPLDGEVA
jgi:two-component system NtrC family sensor kinase